MMNAASICPVRACVCVRVSRAPIKQFSNADLCCCWSLFTRTLLLFSEVGTCKKGGDMRAGIGVGQGNRCCLWHVACACMQLFTTRAHTRVCHCTCSPVVPSIA